MKQSRGAEIYLEQILGKISRAGPWKVTSEQRTEYEKKSWDFLGRLFQAEGTASAKAPMAKLSAMYDEQSGGLGSRVQSGKK